MANVETQFPDERHNPRDAIWTDKAGVTHRAWGASDIGVGHDFIRLLWTACGKKDIPANAATLVEAGDEVTCEACELAQRIHEEEPQPSMEI